MLIALGDLAPTLIYTEMGASSFMKDASEGASATEAGKDFHRGTVLGKKLNLNESEEVENCLNFLELDSRSRTSWWKIIKDHKYN